MDRKQLYVANAGQTKMPAAENIHVPFARFEKPAKPDPLLPELELTEKAKKEGLILASQKQHFLPEVSALMLDWFWANMEKGYYLWAPGSHKRFNWVVSPAQAGIEHSVHMIAESCGEGLPVFGGDGVEIHRLVLKEFYPFTTCLEHAICEGVFNEPGELVDATIHLWEDCEGGCNHITATVQNQRASAPPAFILELMENNPDVKIVPNFATDHEDFEASQWPVFLPTLYKLWENHPDPSQSVRCSLKVMQMADGTYDYAANILKERGR